VTARLGAAFEVLVHPAGKERQLAVTQERHAPVGDPLQEVAVVADQDQRARPAVEQVLQLVERLDVEVVGGLVEQQDVGVVHEQPEELQPPPLAARQVADHLPLRVAAEAQAFQELGGGPLPLAELEVLAYLLHRLQHAPGRVELGELLGQVRQADGLAPDHPAGIGLDRVGEQPQHRRLARPVHPDQPDPVARAELPRQVVEHSGPVPGPPAWRVTSSRS
jgi:hypothetical protein